MRIDILTLVFSFIGPVMLPTMAQQVVNGGFEEIIFSDSNPEIPYPMNWVFAFENEFCNIPLGELTTNSHSGTWAAKLETTDCFGMVKAAWINNFIDTSQFFLPVMGHPLNSRPDQASFYYKYLPINGDTAFYSIFTFSLPDTLEFMDPYWYYADTISYAKGYFINSQTEYVQLIHNFEYQSLEIPQYIQFRFLSNKHAVSDVNLEYDQGHPGTTLWIDDIELIYLSTSMNEDNAEVDVQIFPNPMLDIFEINYSADIFPQSIDVIDCQGRVISMLDPLDRFHSISDWNSGIYFVRIVTKSGTVIKRVMKR